MKKFMDKKQTVKLDDCEVHQEDREQKMETVLKASTIIGTSVS